MALLCWLDVPYSKLGWPQEAKRKSLRAILHSWVFEVSAHPWVDISALAGEALTHVIETTACQAALPGERTGDDEAEVVVLRLPAETGPDLA